MKKRLLLFPVLASLLSLHSLAQEKTKIKFGNVTEKDFETKVYSIDSNASAVVIADIGSTQIVGNSKGGFSLEFKNYRRAHILNKNGYDIGNVSIGLYTDGDAEEELDNLKAVTYNLENGKVVQTKLEVKSAVFKDKFNKNLIIKKFTFPNIKEGSIIEYEYKIHSDFIFNLQPWEFQEQYPHLWSEYDVSIPEFYYYVTLTQGYQSYFIRDQKARREIYQVSETRTAGATERGSLEAIVTDYRLVMKDVPALKEESYTSTINNHISKIEFQLSEIRHPFTPRNVLGNWRQVSEDLLKDEDFGSQLNKDNGWLNDVMGAALKDAKNDMEKAQNIFTYVRDNMTCTNHSRKYLDQPLKNILKNRNGNVAEINLLLIAMLRKARLHADPVMLSTRSHGYVHAIYPMMDRFNYVICLLETGGQNYYLDASFPRLGFGHLPSECYNGHARIIDQNATSIQFSPDSLLERKFTTIFIINDEKGNLVGSLQQTPGYYESCDLRDKIKEKGQEQLLKDIKKAFGTEIEISNPQIDSIDKYEYELGIKYDFDIKEEKGDIIYLNPMFGEGYKENPFKSAERFYPVEMPYAMDETYNLQMEIPTGYVIDEMPEQLVVKLNDQGEGLFEYRISSSGGNISLRSRIIFTRSYFMPEEYEMLREFFNLIVKKQNEQIVFKKKK